MAINFLKNYLLFISLVCLAYLNSFSQSVSNIKFTMLNHKSPITDTVWMDVFNQRREEITFNVSIDVNRNGKWTEFYSDIFEFDRDQAHRHKLLPNSRMILKFPIKNVSKDYQNSWNKKVFRLGMMVFPDNSFKTACHIYSRSFVLKWL